MEGFPLHKYILLIYCLKKLKLKKKKKKLKAKKYSKNILNIFPCPLKIKTLYKPMKSKCHDAEKNKK